MALGSFLQAAAARLARYYIEDLRQFRKLLLQLVAIAAANGVIGVLAAVLFGRQFLTIMYRPEYAMYPSVFAWLMVAAGVSYIASAVGYGLSAARKFDVQCLVYICVALATTVACVFLVPKYGLLGAAWALMTGTLTWCVGFTMALAFALRPQSVEYLRWGQKQTLNAPGTHKNFLRSFSGLSLGDQMIPLLVVIASVAALLIFFRPFVGLPIIFFLGMVGDLQHFTGGISVVKGIVVLVLAGFVSHYSLAPVLRNKTGVEIPLVLFIGVYCLGNALGPGIPTTQATC